MSESLSPDDSSAVERFRAFLRIKSISASGPQGAYQEAVAFLGECCKSFGLEDQRVLELVPKKPILIVTWRGSDPTLPAVLLNSHYDVVPVDESATLADGKIYARGTQDMKCVCMQYIEAVGRLKRLVLAGKLPPLKRTIYLSFLPDEEIGGIEGAKVFVNSAEYKALNILNPEAKVGCALDEGLANPSDAYTVFYGERSPWWVKIHATGPVGHGSRFIPRTAIEKLTGVLSEIYVYRSQQQKLLHPTGECEHGCDHSIAKKLGDVVTINVTAVQGFVAGPAFSDGFAVNCIPPEAIAALDVRIPPTVPLDDIETLLKKWTQEEGLSYKFYNRMPAHYTTAADDSNPWWVVLRNAFEALGRKIEPEIFPAATDSRYFRMGNLPCFGTPSP